MELKSLYMAIDTRRGWGGVSQSGTSTHWPATKSAAAAAAAAAPGCQWRAVAAAAARTQMSSTKNVCHSWEEQLPDYSAADVKI